MPASAIARLRKLCLALPEAHEVEAWSEPTFRVRNKMFAMYASRNNHHGAGRNAVWCKATLLNQSMMIATNPERFFAPPYVGPKGWIGIWLDGDVNWTEVHELVHDSYRAIAPKRLVAQL